MLNLIDYLTSSAYKTPEEADLAYLLAGISPEQKQAAMGFGLPSFRLPNIRLPEIQGPSLNIGMPDIGLQGPSVGLPSLNLPAPQLPSLPAPQLGGNVPVPQLPSLPMPQMPQLQMPNIPVPQLPQANLPLPDFGLGGIDIGGQVLKDLAGISLPPTSIEIPIGDVATATWKPFEPLLGGSPLAGIDIPALAPLKMSYDVVSNIYNALMGEGKSSGVLAAEAKQKQGLLQNYMDLTSKISTGDADWKDASDALHTQYDKGGLSGMDYFYPELKDSLQNWIGETRKAETAAKEATQAKSEGKRRIIIPLKEGGFRTIYE